MTCGNHVQPVDSKLIRTLVQAYTALSLHRDYCERVCCPLGTDVPLIYAPGPVQLRPSTGAQIFLL